MENGVAEILEKVLGHKPNKSEVAGHIADSISSLTENRRIARQEGDAESIKEFSQKIVDLRKEALKLGLDPNDYKGIFRG